MTVVDREACCPCCFAAAERGELDHDLAALCPYRPCLGCVTRRPYVLPEAAPEVEQ